jgi:hypothetical protein
MATNGHISSILTHEQNGNDEAAMTLLEECVALEPTAKRLSALGLFVSRTA